MPVFTPVADPNAEVKASIAKLVKEDVAETLERREAARAMSDEDEKHLVDYCLECVKSSENATKETRQMQRECLRIFQEKEPESYGLKEDWQSRVVIPKPYSTVMFAQGVVRKAFDTDYFSIESATDEAAATFWKKLMDRELGENRSDFATKFSDAVQMSFAIGQSLEMIPVWRPGRGLTYNLTEPWKIFRDPNALPREPQSGMYWIHREWIDYYVLKKLEEEGRYSNVGSWSDYSDTKDLSQEETDAKKALFRETSKFRKLVLVHEFWGTILDKDGTAVLMPNATFTIAGNRVISKPELSPYPTMRWPGISFSPLPDLLQYDGRSILQSVRSLWYFMCSLMCLHNDLLNWVVNPPFEINIDALDNPTDTDNYPGKQYLVRNTASGQQAVRPVELRFRSGEVLANMAYADRNFQQGTCVTDAVAGLPGYRKDMTWRESAQNLEQGLSVFGLMGKNLEKGAINALIAGAETIVANMGVDDLRGFIPDEELGALYSKTSETKLALPPLTSGNFHVSGVSTAMRNVELMQSIRDTILPLVERPAFARYMRPYYVLRSLEKRLNLVDEKIILSEKEALEADQLARQQAQNQPPTVPGGAE